MPNYALDAALITTNAKLANLLYQMQITGYLVTTLPSSSPALLPSSLLS